MLGVEPTAPWPDIRAAHRRAIRAVHPDVGGTAANAARVNRALEVLEAAAAAAPPPVAVDSAPPRPSPAPVSSHDVDRVFVVAEDPRGMLSRLVEAGHQVGEVVFVDPHAGLLEIVVGAPPGVGQLAVTVERPTGDETTISFTLDALGITPAPPIDTVVDALMAALGPP